MAGVPEDRQECGSQIPRDEYVTKEGSVHLRKWPLTSSVQIKVIGICIGEVTGGLHQSNFRGRVGMKAQLWQAQQRMEGEFWRKKQTGLSRTLAVKGGEGNGTPLQYSSLENPMDGGACQAAVHGVAKSRARLSDFTFTFHFHALEKEMATHSSVLAWRIPGTAEPGGLPSMGSHRVGHD